MSEKLQTNVSLVTSKDVSDEEKQQLLDEYDLECLDDLAEQMELQVEELIRQTFEGATIETLEVNTNSYTTTSDSTVEQNAD